MRRLHPPKRGDRLVDRGTYRLADGGHEAFTVHQDAAGRRTLRVESRPEGALWQLELSPEGRPERVECRWREADGLFEAALTCFEDEVLVWRRGAEPISEQWEMPPGYRLLWPPVAGRAECLAGLEDERDARGRAAVMFLLLRRRPLARGGLSGRPVKLGLRWQEDGEEVQPGIARLIALETPGLRPMQAELDAAGRLRGWREAGERVAERLPEPGPEPDDHPEDETRPAEAAPMDEPEDS